MEGQMSWVEMHFEVSLINSGQQHSVIQITAFQPRDFTADRLWRTSGSSRGLRAEQKDQTSKCSNC